MASPTDLWLSESSWLASLEYSNELSRICEEEEGSSLDDSARGDSTAHGEDSTPPPAKRPRVVVACTYCDAQFTQKKSLYRHQRSSSRCSAGHPAQERHPCSFCDKVFTRADVCSRHEKEHHQLLGRRKTDDMELILHKVTQYNMPQSETTMSQHDNQDDYWPQFLQCGELKVVNADNPFEAEHSLSFASHRLHSENEAGTQPRESPSKSLLAFPSRNRSSLERLGASPGYKTSKNIPPCPACRKPFETDKSSLLAHVQSHVQEWQREFICAECQITFQSQENLEFHLLSASRGSCGFIDHDCTGHHPPQQGEATTLVTEHEHLVLSSFLRHWEQAQLDALILGVDSLTVEDSATKLRRWSWSRVRPLSSTRCSSSIMPPSFRSEPRNTNGKARTTIQMIEHKLASLSNLGPSALIRRRAADNEYMLRMSRLNDSLYRAIEEGDVASAGQLLENGADPNARPSNNRPFQISFLTNNHGNYRQRAVYVHSQHLSPLATAEVLGRLEISELLLAYGADSTRASKADLGTIELSGLSMVLEPAGFAPQILRMHAKGSGLRLKARSKRGEVNRLDHATTRDLFDFLETPSTACVSMLPESLIARNCSLALQAVLDLGITANEISSVDGTSLLQYALSMSSAECAMVLIDYGVPCEIDSIPKLVSIALDLAARLVVQGFSKEARRILHRFIQSVPETHRASAHSFLLGSAIEHYDAATVKLVLSDDAVRKVTWRAATHNETMYEDQSGHLREHEVFGPPLSFAVYKGKLDIAWMFLAHGADISECGGVYGSPLCNAVMTGHVKMVQMLLDSGADPRQSLDSHEPPLFCAARCNRADIASALVEKGADLNEHVPDFGTALICAVRGDNLAVAKYLLEAGADINVASTRYGTALCAVLSRSPDSYDDLSMLEFLLAHGADPTIGSPLGSSLDVAIAKRRRYSGGQEHEGSEAGVREMDMVLELMRRTRKRGNS